MGAGASGSRRRDPFRLPVRDRLRRLGGFQTAQGAQPVPRTEAHGTVEVTLAEVAKGTERTVAVDGRRLQVKIPPGVSDGAKIRLRDQGVTLTVKVKPDPASRETGPTSPPSCRLTLSEALLGGEVPVPTPTGPVKLRIRPNTQNGQVITHPRPRPAEARASRPAWRPPRHRPVVLPHLDEPAREEFSTFAEAHPQPDPRERQLMRTERFTQKATEAITAAQQLAEGEGHAQLEALHLLYALVEQPDGVVPAVLERIGQDPASARRADPRRAGEAAEGQRRARSSRSPRTPAASCPTPTRWRSGCMTSTFRPNTCCSPSSRREPPSPATRLLTAAGHR